jgi:hypothetical protein
LRSAQRAHVPALADLPSRSSRGARSSSSLNTPRF